MQIAIKKLSAARKDDHLIVLINNENQLSAKYLSKEELSYARKEFRNEKKSVVINQLRRTIYIHLITINKNISSMFEAMRKHGNNYGSKLNAAKLSGVVVTSEFDKDSSLAFIEGMALGNYQFLKYRSNKRKEQNTLKEINIVSSEINEKDLSDLKVLLYSVYQSRDLVNEPQSFLTATELANQFSRLAKESGFKIEVLHKEEIITHKMGGLLAVNQGSPEPPTFSIMEHKPQNAVNKKPIVIVGKGVVYDTGGMSLKPTANSMDYMKCDMAGGAVVGSVMYVLAKLKFPIHVVGIVPATDNRPDGNAYVPGDVVTMMSGKTVEVLNTDAEGRMILADALHFAKRYKPELTLDFATLTGAAAAAIGPYGIVAMGTANNDHFSALKKAGNTVYERIAEFPFWDEYDDLIKSDVADIKNTGGPSGGAITAGKFLANFVDYPFLHLDIAGPAFSKSNDSYRGKNGTGVGVRLMIQFFKDYIDSKTNLQ